MKNKVNEVFYYSLIMVVTALQLSCNTAGENKSKPATSFVNTSWKLQSLSVAPAIDWDLDGKKDTDIFSLMEDCEKDDILSLRNDSMIVRNKGGLKCGEADEQEKETGSWSYDQPTKKLVLKEDNEQQEFTVVESSDNKLVLTYTWKATNGTSHQMTATYSAK